MKIFQSHPVKEHGLLLPTTVYGEAPGSQTAFLERPIRPKFLHYPSHLSAYAPPTQTAAFPCLLTTEIKGE